MLNFQNLQYSSDEYLRSNLKAFLNSHNDPYQIVRHIQLLLSESVQGLSLKDIDDKNRFIAIKEELYIFLQQKSILAELVFKEMWWHNNYRLRCLASYLIPLFTKDFYEILPYLRRLDNQELTELVARQLFFLHHNNTSKFIVFIKILVNQGNKYQRLLGEYLIKLTVSENNRSKTFFKPILNLLTSDNEMEIRSFAREIILKYFSENI